MQRAENLLQSQTSRPKDRLNNNTRVGPVPISHTKGKNLSLVKNPSLCTCFIYKYISSRSTLISGGDM